MFCIGISTLQGLANDVGRVTSDGVAAVGIMQYSTTRERAAVEPSGNRVELFRHDARNVLHDCVMPRSSFAAALIYPHAR